MEKTQQIQWSTSRFIDESLEKAFQEDNWGSVRILTACTMIGFGIAWLASVSLDNLYLRGTPYFGLVAGSRSSTGVIGLILGLWMLIMRPAHTHQLLPILVYGWMFLSTVTAIVVSCSYPFLETTADGRTDLLISTCYWMTFQMQGLGITMSAWRKGVIFMAIGYASSYTIQAIYWAPTLEHTLEGQIIVVIAANSFAIILAYLFGRRARQRFLMAKLYETAKNTAEKAQQFTTFLLAATGHDIRQPVFAMSLNASLLEDHINDRDWEQAAKVAERQSQALAGVSGLISSVLELSQLDTDRRRVTPELLELDRMIATVLAPIRSTVLGRGVELRSVKTSLKVDADRGIVEHILANLVVNAVHHADASRVLIGARRRDDSIDLMVIDDGKGLNDKSTILTIADIKLGKNRPASRGLGVEIMFRLAEKAGLDLTLTSEPGRGVSASLRCPARK